MDENHDNVKNYRKMTIDLIRDNPSYLAIGVLIVGYFMYSFIYQYNDGLTEFITSRVQGVKDRATIESAKNTNPELASSLIDGDINYISQDQKDDPEQLQKPGDEVGEISAIQSEQVTYHQNKYVIQPGDSLASVAEQVYGDRDAWVRIAEANGIASPDHIEVGMELVIPR